MRNESEGPSQDQQVKRGASCLPDGSGSGGGVSDDDQEPSPPLDQSDECGESLGAKENKGLGKSSLDGCSLDLRYRLIVRSYRKSLIDPSNPSIKQIEDCLTEPKGNKAYGLGIIPDDSPEFCDQPLFFQHKTQKGEEEKTEVSIISYYI